ncbi:FG-GAP repeat domain-containing protein [Adhaeribacter radiodurans]|uniref:VCBS repeat-containing protein n=1 Tax=Adhaeribacter radiodurans TaxID=2745197 RepID=A0A7L7LDE1_9BACT|nr:VCBS repeat-containing protein [Adhaeribacter radiodurans]QMU30714.1 VCBS repeat-containing protein [Adhaeribacter radiodurans]
MRLFILCCLGIWLFSSCSIKKNTTESGIEPVNLRAVLPDTTKTAALDGNNLAHVYCSACHQFPEPNLLPKAIWEEKVLPAMGQRLGIGANLGMYARMAPQEITTLLKANIYPDKALIAKKDWIKILSYYKSNSPEKLPEPKPLALSKLLLFDAIPLTVNKGRYALTSLLQYEPTTKELLVGDRRNKLFRVNAQLHVIDSIQLDTPPVAVVRAKNEQYKVLTIGSLNPSDAPYGRLYSWQLASATKAPVVLPQLTDLQRPVKLTSADLNNDNQEDLVICHYGNQLGKLSWYEGKPDGTYQEHLLKKLPGSRQVVIQDMNHDNRPDIVALFAQASESIFIFYNQGNGHFEEEKVLQLPPVYGSSYFELADFNKDGALDILISNGDNGDYSFILKPYHGIRLFLNNEQNEFQEASFLPLPGASITATRDFDEDGDLDIAAISYFADFARQPESGFVYFENKGNNTFAGKTFPEAATGRWLTLTTGDIDQDGDEDIMLGSFIFATTPVPPPLQEQWIKSSPSVLVLKNRYSNNLH